MTRTVLSLAIVAALVGCQPGYMKPSDLAQKGQGPADCKARCKELGLEMGALVLLGDQLPACVCQVSGRTTGSSADGASATGAGYVVFAAAAAAARQQAAQQQAAAAAAQPQTYRPR